MPRGYPSLTNDQKEEIILRIKEKGEKVSDLSKEYGIIPQTIYSLLKQQVVAPNLALEVAKLKKEKNALLQIVGQLVFDDKVSKGSKRFSH